MRRVEVLLEDAEFWIRHIDRHYGKAVNMPVFGVANWWYKAEKRPRFDTTDGARQLPKRAQPYAARTSAG